MKVVKRVGYTSMMSVLNWVKDALVDVCFFWVKVGISGCEYSSQDVARNSKGEKGLFF